MSDVPLRDYVDRLFEEQEKHIARALAQTNSTRRDQDASQSEVIGWVSIGLGLLNMFMWLYVVLHK